MKVSLIINTACGDARVVGNRNPYRSRRYGERAELLRTEVLPRALDAGFDEVIVAGVFPSAMPDEFPNITWVTVPSKRFNRWDGLLQREMGARFASGDVLVFCHDDHAPGEDFARNLREHDPEWDILCPKRIHFQTGETLNNGRDDNYMGSHCYCMRRWIWAALSLTEAPDEFWDIYLTPLWRNLGARIVWTDDLTHYDIEATADEL